MPNTPDIFARILHDCNVTNTTNDIFTVIPPRNKCWNNSLHETKHGNPYLVLQCNNTKFSISRVRPSSFVKWNYILRWPYPSYGKRQYSQKVEASHFIPELIRTNS